MEIIIRTRHVVFLVLISIVLLNVVKSQPDIASAIINRFGSADITDLVPLPANRSLVVFRDVGSTFGPSAGGVGGFIGIVQFSIGTVAPAVSQLSASLDVSCASGTGNITLSKITQDASNSSRFWVSGVCHAPNMVGGSVSIGSNIYLFSQEDYTGFLFAIDTALTIVREPTFYPNASIDNIIAGTGTFSNSIYLTGRIFGNTVIGGWTVTKTGVGVNDAFVARANLSLVVSSLTYIYCQFSAIRGSKIDAPFAIWGPPSVAKPVGRLFVSVHQNNCPTMNVTSYATPSAVHYMDTYPCTFTQCPYGAEFWGDTGRWNADASGRFFRHFDPDPAQVGVLSAMSAIGDDFVSMAASEYNAPSSLNHTRWRRINYDLKNGGYDYPTGWRNPFYQEYPIEAIRLFQYGTLLTSVGSWSLRLPLGTLLSQPIGLCDLAFFSILASDGSANKVVSFGATSMCFEPYNAWQLSASQIVVAVRYSSNSSYTFPSGSLVLPISSRNDSALILFSTTPPPPVAPLPPASAPAAAPLAAPVQEPIQPPQPSQCRIQRCSGRGDCIANTSSGCICDSNAFGIDCSCNNPVVSPLSYCLDGGNREILIGNITANSTNPIILIPGGIVTVNGSLTLTNGTIKVVVSTSGSAGQIVADGCVTIDGNLVIETNQLVTNGDTITIVRSPCIQGNFTNVAVRTQTNQQCVSASTVQDPQSLAIVFTVAADCSNQGNAATAGVPWYAIAIPIIVVVIGAIIVVVLWMRWRNKEERRASTNLRALRASRTGDE